MKITLLTEAGYAYGLGHLVRCIRLKKLLAQSCKNIKLYHYGDAAIKTIRGSSYLNWLDEDVFDSIIKKTDIIIIDSYHARVDFYQKAAKNCKKLIVLDDTNRLPYPRNCTIINGALQAQKLYTKSKNHLLGIKYAMVDGRFSQPKTPKKNIQNILITFGGSEFMDIINQTLKTLEYFPCKKHIILPQKYDKPIIFEGNYYQNISQTKMANIMKKCDVAISAGGGTLNELAQAKVPTLIIPIAQNQIFQSEQWELSGGMKITTEAKLKQDFDTIAAFKTREKMIAALANIDFGSALGVELQKIISKARGA